MAGVHALTDFVTRRDWLRRTANGFGALALADLLHQQSSAELHHPAQADHVIFLYMDGGPSQVDTFDPKPLLDRENGKPFTAKMEPTQFNNNGNTLGSPWKFTQHGQSGTTPEKTAEQRTGSEILIPVESLGWLLHNTAPARPSAQESTGRMQDDTDTVEFELESGSGLRDCGCRHADRRLFQR